MARGIIIKAAPADQARLLELQAVDTVLTQLRHRRSHLPEQERFLKVRAAHEQATEELVAADTRLSDLELVQAKAEADLVPVRERRQRNQQRIDDGSVADPKALATMIDEVEHLGRRISTLEDEELEVMQEVEDATTMRDAVRAKVTELAEQLAGVRQERDAVATQIDAEAATRTTERDRIAAELPPALIATYDKLRTSHSGIGAAELVHRRCSGCQIDANAADLRAYAEAPEDEVIRCEECGRILVRSDRSGL
ncbi:zinc ribbon domain-containing protein [Propionibacteriaceae bacterium Y2011]